MTLLSVRGLSIAYDTPGGEPVSAVRNVSFDIAGGEFVGLVGESGSGKSTLGYAIARLLKAPGRIAGGEVLLDGVDLAGLTAAEVRRQHRGGVAMVLQSGMNALNPVRTIEKHFLDIFEAHGHVAPGQRDERMRELLRKVELSPDVLHRYSGELSGGMRQRVSIALALSLDPRLVVFDEPTTALDVLVQKAVMETITSLQASEGFTAILISHDLGVVLEATDRVLVMHDGRIVEDASSEGIATSPSDDYTRMLLSHYDDPRAEKLHVPGFESERPRTEVSARPGRSAREAIVVDGVGKIYRRARGEQPVVAVDDVSFTLEPGASLALVGASGSGKSTLARLVTGIESPTSGSVSFGGRAVDRLRGRRLKSLHHEIQLVFQDPYAALNPMHTVGYTLSRPVINFSDRRGAAVRSRVYELLETVGLTPVEQFAAKLPHQLSGGQRQRVVIARALASDPQVIVADEPVSMLDVSLRAGVLSLLRGLGDQWGVSMLYITHDLLSARLVTDEILVLSQGRVVERGNTVSVLQHPTDPYTVRLLDAIPVPTSRGPKS